MNNSPGYLLQKFFKEKFNDNEKTLREIDDHLYEEGELLHHMNMSGINYLIRRLINTAEFYKRKYDPAKFSQTLYLDKLREFLEYNTRFNEQEVDTIITYCINSIDTKRQQRKGTKRKILKVGKESGNARCYICGKELIFEYDDAYSAEVEHIWPLVVGGNSEESNLKLSCKKCNKAKDYYIDSSDFHFEEITLFNLESDPNFNSAFKWKFRVAVWAKSNYSCLICQRPAEKGELNFSRENKNDSWHFLNINTYCDKHYRKD